MNIKKLLLSGVIALFMTLSLSSCVTPVEAQATIGTYPSVEVIVSDGVPYYIDNTIVYWTYGGRYWYPYYHNGCRGFRPYARPFRHHFHAVPYHHRHHYIVVPNRRPTYHMRSSTHFQNRSGFGQYRHHMSPSGGHRGHFGGRR